MPCKRIIALLFVNTSPTVNPFAEPFPTRIGPDVENPVAATIPETSSL